MKTGKLSCEKARNICIVKSLAKLGHFGIGEGGNVIDLICLIENCEVKEALRFLDQESIIPTYSSPNNHRPKKSKIQITAVKPLDHPALLYYLKSRKINVALAGDFCNEVWYQWKEKQYYALGLKNKLGGWELRNKYFKNSSSPKTYSIIRNGSKQLVITEGIFDFLSLAAMDKSLVENSDCIILNSLAFLKRIEILVPVYDRVLLYLDNDPAGIKATASLLNQYDHTTDHSDSYKDYVDLNEKLKNETDLV
jgi:hypothetical protein